MLMKKAILFLCLASCARSPSTARTAEKKPEARSATKTESPPEVHADFKTDIKGQLDRIDESILDVPDRDHFRPWGDVSGRLLELNTSIDEDRLRAVGGWPKTGARPSAAIALAADFSVAQREEPYQEKQLRKSKARYAGRPFWIEHAKVVSIKEVGGGTLAEVAPSGWHDHIIVATRFISDFVEGDRVEVVGFLTSSSVEGGDAEMLAGAAFLREGSIFTADALLSGQAFVHKQKRPAKAVEDADQEN